MTNGALSKTERMLKVAAAFIFVGLAIQLVTLLRNHPLAFMAFIFVGSSLVLIGAVLYLWSVVLHSETEGQSSKTEEI
jgi:uncharacterized membrane protein YozB (DUF420 family)